MIDVSGSEKRRKGALLLSRVLNGNDGPLVARQKMNSLKKPLNMGVQKSG